MTPVDTLDSISIFDRVMIRNKGVWISGFVYMIYEGYHRETDNQKTTFVWVYCSGEKFYATSELDLMRV
jgi:hypothetical protein